MTSAPNTCLSCSALLDADARFCGACGVRTAPAAGPAHGLARVGVHRDDRTFAFGQTTLAAATRGSSRGRLLAVGALLVFGIALVALALRHRAPEVRVRVVSDAGRDSLEFDVPGSVAGAKIRFGGQDRTLQAGRARFALSPDAIRVGDNVVTFDLVSQNGDVAPGSITLSVDYRVTLDTARLRAGTASVDVVVTARPGSQVALDGQPLALDAKGRAVRRDALEFGNETSQIEHVVRYRIQPPVGEAQVGELRTPLVVSQEIPGTGGAGTGGPLGGPQSVVSTGPYVPPPLTDKEQGSLSQFKGDTAEYMRRAGSAAARPPEIDELASLYKELMKFKRESMFKEVGFGACCKYNPWLRQVEKMNASSRSSRDMWLDLGVVPGDLLTLGMEYLHSKGEETEYTRTMTAAFEAALFPKAAKKGFAGKMSSTDRLCRHMATYKRQVELMLAEDYAGAAGLLANDATCATVQKNTPMRGPLDTKKLGDMTYILVEAQGVGLVWVMEDWVEFATTK